MVTYDDVKDLFDYNTEHGGLYWKKINKHLVNRIFIGERAGHLNSCGYRQITVNYKRYYEHRLVWLWHYGKFPEGILDHKNRNPDDNRIENLREATYSENAKNTKLNSNNKSGHKGVCWSKADNKWKSYVSIDGKRIHIGYFDNMEDAVLAYEKYVV